MSVLPHLIGFSVSIDPAPPTAGRMPLAVAGRRIPVEAGGLTGVAVAANDEVTGALAIDGEVTLLLAGELYDRDRLARAIGGDQAGPAGASDTELVLAGLRRYGPSLFRLLNGRFAAVVVTPQRVVVATDHAASVPLYLRLTGSGVTVATEAKAMGGGTGPATEVAGTAPVPGAAGARRVRAGHLVMLDRASGTWAAQAWPTWTPAYERLPLDPSEAVAAVADRLGAAVRDRSGGAAVTVVLSGGIDSSAVAALASDGVREVGTVSLGTDAGDEFEAAWLVVRHLNTRHTELKMSAADLVGELPYAVAAAEIADPEVLEYLLPLVALYRRLPGDPQRVLTGYGADIPLGGMHRTTEPLQILDELVTADMDSFDGLNELSPVLAGVTGHWTTHPYWDREVLDLLVRLEPGLKRRHGRDKWVLREAMAGRLPDETVRRPKLGIHEGTALTSSWSLLLRDAGVPADGVARAKQEVARRLFDTVVVHGVAPGEVVVGDVVTDVAREGA